jgi:8-oxo-dGTP diphosphatase
MRRIPRISVAGVAERDGKVLIARRKPGTSIGECWEFPGGKAENGETPEDALRREWWEEMGVRPAVGELLFTGGFSNGPQTYRLLAYAIELEDARIELSEHSKAQWVDVENLDHFQFAPSDGQIVDYLLERT